MIQSKADRMRAAGLVKPGTVAEAALDQSGFAVYPAAERETKFPSDGTVVVLSGHTSSNDEGGHSYDRSNYQVLQRDYGDHPDVEFREHVQLRGESENEALIEVINSLASYPILDEFHHSEMEFEEQNQKIDSELAEELARLVKARYWHEIDDDDYLDVVVTDAIDGLFDNGVIAANFRELAERSHAEWDGTVINVKRIADRSGTLHRLLMPSSAPIAWSWLSSVDDSIRKRLEAAASLPPGGIPPRYVIPLLNVLYDQGYAQESGALGYGDATTAALAMDEHGLVIETVDSVVAHLSTSSQVEAEFAKNARDAWMVASLRQMIQQADEQEIDVDSDYELLRSIAEAVPVVIEISKRYKEKIDGSPT